MSNNSDEPLSNAHAAAILELGRSGSGGHFDQHVMRELFARGLIEVRSSDRRVALTKRGQSVFDELSRQPIVTLGRLDRDVGEGVTGEVN